MDIKQEPVDITDRDPEYITQWRNYKDEFVKIEYTPTIKSEKCFSPADVDIERQSVFQDVAMGLGNIKNEINSMSAETTVENVLQIKVEEFDGERSTSPELAMDITENIKSQRRSMGNDRNAAFKIKIATQDIRELSSDTKLLTSKSDSVTPSMNNSNAFSDLVPFTELRVDKKSIKKEFADSNGVTRDFCLNNSFPEQVALVKLKRVLLYKKYFVCGVCYAIFPNVIEQKRHKEIHNQSIGLNGKSKNKLPDSQADKLFLGMYSCTKCLFKCIMLSDMKFHEKTHCGEKATHKANVQEISYKCEQCNYTSVHSWHMKTHKMIHSGEKPFKCKECSYSCINFNDMKRHAMIHSGEKPFKCDKCDYSCIRSSSLKKHKFVHSGENSLKCKKCNYASLLSSDMKTHKLTHSEKKPFKCDVCGYSTINSCYIKTHKMIHSGKKPFNCDMCSYSCNRSSTMKKHKMIHSGEKPFKCVECDFSCRDSSHLKSHAMLHSGEKPLKCGECDYACIQPRYLRVHKMKHSTEKPAQDTDVPITI